MFTMAALTLVYGSLSDRYGRRPVLLAGILLFVAGSALAADATTIELSEMSDYASCPGEPTPVTDLEMVTY